MIFSPAIKLSNYIPHDSIRKHSVHVFRKLLKVVSFAIYLRRSSDHLKSFCKMSLLKDISDTFWSEKVKKKLHFPEVNIGVMFLQFWLPPNITWVDMESGRNGINYADYRHLIYPIPMSFVIILLRIFVDK